MPDKPPPDLDKMTGRVENFVVRGRRVPAHSLAEQKTVEAMARGSFSVGRHPETSETVIVLSAPPEEAVESLAARMRPTILREDLVHHGKVLSALRLLAPSEEAQALSNEMDKRWKTVDPKCSSVTAYAMQASSTDGSEPTAYTSDNTLAFAWFYGDLMHANEKAHATGAGFSIRERYLAAVALVARVTAFTLETLALIEFLKERGDLTLKDDDVWTADVVASETRWILPAKLYVGEEHAEMPEDITAPLGGGRSEIDFPRDKGT